MANSVHHRPVALATSVGWLLFAQAERTASKTQAQKMNAETIAAAAGTKATTTADELVRLSWLRRDVSVKIDGIALKPFAGLGSWAAFSSTEHGAKLIGDTVVFQDEVTPAIDAAFANDLEVMDCTTISSLTNPKSFSCTSEGMATRKKMAAGVKAVWGAIKKVRSAHENPVTSFLGSVPRDGTSDVDAIEKTLGHKSETQSGMAKVMIARDAMMHDQKVGGSMRLTTWAAFSGSDEFAAIDLGFAMTAEGVQPVLRSMRQGNLHIVSLHNHMIGEQPAIFFVHFWGTGKASERAMAFKDALAVQAKTNRLAKYHVRNIRRKSIVPALVQMN